MPFLRHARGVVLLCAFLASAVAHAQTTIGGGAGGVNVGGHGGGTKIGPVDTTAPAPPPPSPPPPGRDEPWNPPGMASFPPPPFLPFAETTAAGPQRVPLAPEDDSEWLFWWRIQRWGRLENAGSPETTPVVTPGPGRPASVQTPLAAPISRPADLIVPLLLGAWREQPRRAEMRAVLLLGLARAGAGPEIGAALRQGLADEDPRVAETAALGLGILGEPHAIPLLASLVRGDPSARALLDGKAEPTLRLRSFAGFGLGLIAARCPYPVLRQAIADALLAGLSDRAAAGADLETACTAALGLFPGDDAPALVPALLAVLRENARPEAARAAAATSVAKLLARAGDSPLAREGFRVLARRAVDRGESSEVRGSCVLALGRLGTLPQIAPAAVEPLLARFREDSDPRVRHLAALALAEIGAGGHPVAQVEALPALLGGLETGPDRDQGWCALALGWCGLLAAEQGRALPGLVAQRLLAGFPDRNGMRKRAAAGLALGILGYAPAEGAMLEALAEIGHPGLRSELLAGLVLLGSPRLLAVLPDELARLDPFDPGYQAVLIGLARQQPELLLAILTGLAERSSAGFEGEYAAAIGLGWLVEDPRAIAPLVRLWREARAPFEIEVAAVLSLGRVAEARGPRWNAGYLDLLNPYAATPTQLGTPAWLGVCDRL